jgi:lipopolysaccharide/colanic/teichoic acid biosynthesis glycosyltransferase
MSLNVGQTGKRSLAPPEVDAAALLGVAAPARPNPTIRKSAKKLATHAASVSAAPGLVILPLPRADTKSYEITKRLFDLIVGSILFLIALPMIAAAAAWIRLESKGSPFFFQTRLGKNGKPFRIFKLRGMYIDSRERYPELYDYSHNRSLDFYFHYNTDPRVTNAGRFLRRTSIDELPNLWNVVMGDMSLVGPRPEIPDILEMYGPYREEYLSVKPGISCRSKITGRDQLTKRESIEFDLQYIRRRGPSEDLSILWRTLLSVLSRRDVF